MAEAESLAFLESQLAAEIASFDSSRRFYRGQHYRFTLATATLSATTTVLIAAEKSIGWDALSLCALVASATITVVSARDQFLRSRELWVQKTDTWMALQNIAGRLNYENAKCGALSQETVDRYFIEFNKALMDEHGAWKSVRNTKGSSPATGKKPP